MQLSYRGSSYNAATQSSPNSSAAQNASQPNVRLMYQGQAYNHSPQANPTQQLAADAPTVTLMYRGQAYQRQLRSAYPVPQSRALNWRWQLGSQA
jgi:Domain of unknown function (DUF4278)